MTGTRHVGLGSTPFSGDSIERYLSFPGNNIKVHSHASGLFKRLCIYNAPAPVGNFASYFPLRNGQIFHTLSVKGGIVRIPGFRPGQAGQFSALRALRRAIGNITFCGVMGRFKGLSRCPALWTVWLIWLVGFAGIV
jgi:hypothetical protein